MVGTSLPATTGNLRHPVKPGVTKRAHGASGLARELAQAWRAEGHGPRRAGAVFRFQHALLQAFQEGLFVHGSVAITCSVFGGIFQHSNNGRERVGFRFRIVRKSIRTSCDGIYSYGWTTTGLAIRFSTSLYKSTCSSEVSSVTTSE